MTPHIPAEHGERLIEKVDEHWVRFVWPAVLATLLLAISLVLFALAGLGAHHHPLLSHVSFAFGMLLFCLTQHWLFMMLLGDSLDCIVVTNRRLVRIHAVPLFVEDILEISFKKMKTVDAVKNGLLQNVLRYGTLVFETKLVSVPYVWHPNRMAKVIQQAMDES